MDVIPGGQFEEDVFDATFRQGGIVQTSNGPRSIAFTSNDSAWVYNFIDRQLAEVDVRSLRDFLAHNPGPGRFLEGVFDHTRNETLVSLNRFSPEVEHGRKLFFAANDSVMATTGGAVSCATCHFFDARDDGLTWSFGRGPRQTPSLAGLVSLRAPVRWDGLAATVADDALGTSQGLMGGVGMTQQDALAIEAYIDHTPDVDIPLRGVNDPEIELGRQLFQRPDVNCASCHSGALFSDLQFYNVNGFDGVKTPSLLNLEASAPYLHDGSAATIRDLLVRLRDGSKGSTANLNDQELNALERYLKTL